MVLSSPRVRYWREKRTRGLPLFAAACASASEAAACLPLAPDLILYHPGFSLRDGNGETGMLGALAPLGNANEEADAGLAPLPSLCAPCPVAMGVCGADPFLLRGPAFAAWRAAGLEGIANFPTLGLIDGNLRGELEDAGLGMGQEIACLREAHEAGFCTVGLVCSPDDAAACAAAGCDVLIVHLGLTPEYAPVRLAAARETWKGFAGAVRPRGESAPLLLLHGDHLSEPSDHAAGADLMAQGCDGIFAAGGTERVRQLRAAFA